MQSASTFHLEWSNHLGNMQAVLESLYMHQSLVDVTIACRDGILKAHKVILSACSPYFEAVFQETPCKHPVLILKGVSVREMQALLRFMYRGQVDVPEADLNTLVATACEFKVKGFAVDVMRGADDSRPASPSEHDSENEVNDGGRNTSSRGWKKSDKNDGIKNVSQEGIVSDVNEEMSVTPVIVESQSLKEPLSEAKSEEEDNEKEEKEQKNGEEGHDDKQSASQKSAEEAEPAAEGGAATSVISSGGSGSNGSANGNAGENAPFRRETRYKGQKRVDVGLGRPAIVRPRSVDKRESSSSGIELRHSTQPVKKQRMLTVTRKVEHSADSDHAGEDQGSDQTEEKNIAREPSVPEMTISACPSEDGPMQFVRIKAEAESAEEEEEEEATADMFCIPHLQELPEGDADGTGGPSTASEMVLTGGWAQPEAMVPPSGREQRAVAAETGAEEGEGDMACPYCFTRCSKFSDLKRHMRLHTEDKPHECEFCSLAFARASHLARHRRTHTGERPFRCPAPACERTFSRQDKLKLHTQRAHPGLPCEAVQGGSFMRIRGRRRVRDKALPLGLRLGLAPPRGALSGPGRSSTTLPARTTTLGPAVISLPFGDTSYLTSLSLGQQRYSDLTISPVMAPSSTGGGAGPGVGGPVGGAEDLLKSVRQLGECTIQTLPSKVLAE